MCPESRHGPAPCATHGNLPGPGYGSCVLRNPRAAKIVQGALLHFDNERYRQRFGTSKSTRWPPDWSEPPRIGCGGVRGVGSDAHVGCAVLDVENERTAIQTCRKLMRLLTTEDDEFNSYE
jgi:hypothetical protein